MSFRDTEVDQADTARRVSAVSSRAVATGLPDGFSWQVTVNPAGEPTLNVVHTDSGRVIFYGE